MRWGSKWKPVFKKLMDEIREWENPEPGHQAEDALLTALVYKLARMGDEQAQEYIQWLEGDGRSKTRWHS